MRLYELAEQIMISLYRNPNVREQDHKHNAITAVKAALALQQAQLEYMEGHEETAPKEVTPEMIQNTLDFIEQAGSCKVVARYAETIEAKCGACMSRTMNDPKKRLEKLPYVPFLRVDVLRGDKKHFECFACSVCGHLVDVQMVRCLQEEHPGDLMLY